MEFIRYFVRFSFSYPAICLHVREEGSEAKMEEGGEAVTVRCPRWSSGLGGGVRGGGGRGAQRRTNVGTKATWKKKRHEGKVPQIAKGGVVACL